MYRMPSIMGTMAGAATGHITVVAGILHLTTSVSVTGAVADGGDGMDIADITDAIGVAIAVGVAMATIMAVITVVVTMVVEVIAVVIRVQVVLDTVPVALMVHLPQ